MSQTRALLLWLLLAAMLGCTVGPNYQRPDLAVPQQWAHADQPGLSTGVVAVLQWWHTLQDPMLDALMERAIYTNLDLRIAAASCARGACPARGGSGRSIPDLSLSSAYAHTCRSINVPTPAFDGDLFQSGFDASWGLDLFGRLRRTVEGASANLATTEDNRRDVLIALLAEVARNYVDVHGSQQRLDIAGWSLATPVTASSSRMRLVSIRCCGKTSAIFSLVYCTFVQYNVLHTSRDSGWHVPILSRS